MKKYFILILFTTIVLSLFLFNQDVKSGSEHNVSGWAWSENIGWISLNCENEYNGVLENHCDDSNYGVHINEDGLFSGYAWSENIHWISFADFDRDGDIDANDKEIPGSPCEPNCKATFDSETGIVSGWARALSYNDDWDGWISLGNSTYGVFVNQETGEFEGWAWGSDIIGWINFNCDSPETGDTCSISDYKVKASSSFNTPPVASWTCNNSNCGNGSSCGGTWIAYQTTPESSLCIFVIENKSSDSDGNNTITSKWYLDDREISSDCSCNDDCLDCNYTPQGIEPGDYIVKLYVEDSENESDFITHSLTIKKEIKADFMCSIDEDIWQKCDEISLSEDEVIYIKDDSLISEEYSSEPSEGALITARTWKRSMPEGGFEIFETNSDSAETTLIKNSGIIRLEVEDGVGRIDTKDYSINIKFSLPEWEETHP